MALGSNVVTFRYGSKNLPGCLLKLLQRSAEAPPMTRRELDRLMDRLRPLVVRSCVAAAGEGGLMTLETAQHYLGLGRTRFFELRTGRVELADGVPPFPDPIELGGCKLFRKTDLDAWIARLPRQSSWTAEP